MDHHGGGFASPWAAVLGHHHSMPSMEHTHGFTGHHGHPAAPMPMNLHVPQGFSYYRCEFFFKLFLIFVFFSFFFFVFDQKDRAAPHKRVIYIFFFFHIKKKTEKIMTFNIKTSL